MMREGGSSAEGLEGLDEDLMAKVVEVRSLSEFFVLQTFCRDFRTTLRLPKFNVEELERAFVLPTTAPFLLELVCRLLEPQTPAAKINPLQILQAYADDEYYGDWEENLAHLCTQWQLDEAENWLEAFPESNPLTHSTFFDIEPVDRVKMLSLLVDWKLSDHPDVRTRVEELREAGEEDPPVLIAHDSSGRAFYHDGGLNARLYREDRIDWRKKDCKPRWSTFCITVDEVKDLVSRTARSRHRSDKHLVEALNTMVDPLVEKERLA